MAKFGKISVTRDYDMFHPAVENRSRNIKKHKRLMDSMREYGFLKSYPIVCVRDSSNRLVIKDGQHRLEIARVLGLEVAWVEEEVEFDIATVNSAACGWTLMDYAEKWARNGLKAYQELIDFSKSHRLPLSMAVSLLGGTSSFCNVSGPFRDGTFRVKDRDWADRVASIYSPMAAISGRLRTLRFLEACMAVCRVKSFDPKRLIRGAERCREKLVPYSTRDANLTMLEEVYNFGRSTIVSLKNEALMAMRERNPSSRANSAKREVASAV